MTLEITLLPLGDVAPDDLDNLAHDLAALGVRARIAAARDIPAQAHNARRRQYRADMLLHQAGAVARDTPVLAVTGHDLYVENFDYVLGLADSPGLAAVISLHRLRWQADATQFRARAVKEVIHELGHTLGLGHCRNPQCVMHFSNSLADTDRKDPTPCTRCRARGLLAT